MSEVIPSFPPPMTIHLSRKSLDKLIKFFWDIYNYVNEKTGENPEFKQVYETTYNAVKVEKERFDSIYQSLLPQFPVPALLTGGMKKVKTHKKHLKIKNKKGGTINDLNKPFFELIILSVIIFLLSVFIYGFKAMHEAQKTHDNSYGPLSMG